MSSGASKKVASTALRSSMARWRQHGWPHPKSLAPDSGTRNPRLQKTGVRGPGSWEAAGVFSESQTQPSLCPALRVPRLRTVLHGAGAPADLQTLSGASACLGVLQLPFHGPFLAGQLLSRGPGRQHGGDSGLRGMKEGHQTQHRH